MDLNFIRQNIKNRRKSVGITQRDMANRLFMDERTYSKVERGEKKSMDITLLASIADILNTDVPTLMQDPAKKTVEVLPIHLSSKEYQELVEEIRLLKKDIKEMIECHKEALEALTVNG